MGSFRSQTFEERGLAPVFPVWPARDILNEKPRPAGNLSIIQEIGDDVERLGLIVKVSAAELKALYDEVLNDGELVFGWETVDALLVSVTDAAEQGAGHDVYSATLNLMRL